MHTSRDRALARRADRHLSPADRTMSGSTVLAQLAVQRFRERALLTLPRAGRAELAAFRRPTLHAAGAVEPASKPKRAPSFELANPFMPTKASKHWRAPVYSLRRQAVLVAAARLLGPEALALLPPGPKLRTPAPASSTSTVTPAWADVNVSWTGPVLEEKTGPSAGRAYIGRKRAFKGHKWERVLRKRQKHQHILLKDMSQRIQRYKNVRRSVTSEVGVDADYVMRVALQTEEAKPTQAEHITQAAEVTVLEYLLYTCLLGVIHPVLPFMLTARREQLGPPRLSLTKVVGSVFIISRTPTSPFPMCILIYLRSITRGTSRC